MFERALPGGWFGSIGLASGNEALRDCNRTAVRRLSCGPRQDTATQAIPYRFRIYRCGVCRQNRTASPLRAAPHCGKARGAFDRFTRSASVDRTIPRLPSRRSQDRKDTACQSPKRGNAATARACRAGRQARLAINWPPVASRRMPKPSMQGGRSAPLFPNSHS